MKPFRLTGTVLATSLTVGVGMASATPGHVTPDVIFGSGNANGGFTIVDNPGLGLELGLRAKLRYDLTGQPQNIFNWDGVNTYRFNPNQGNPPGNQAIWNYEWSINSNFNGEGGNLNNFSYNISITGPGISTGILVNPYNPFSAGILGVGARTSTVGTNDTVNGGGVNFTGGCTGSLLNLTCGAPPSNFNVAQNSYNIGFFPSPADDPQAEGLYSVTLSALSGGNTVLSNTIFIEVVPEINGNALAHVLFGLGALKLWLLSGLRNRRRPEPVSRSMGAVS